MDDQIICETLAALDRALAKIALAVAGTPAKAADVIDSLGRGEMTPATRAFLSEGAALVRARRLLGEAIQARPRTSLRKVA
jgi:hypothetical protein